MNWLRAGRDAVIEWQSGFFSGISGCRIIAAPDPALELGQKFFDSLKLKTWMPEKERLSMMDHRLPS